MTPEAGGRLAARGRPTPLVEVRPHERVQRHTAEHIVDVLPHVQILDVPLLQMGDQLVEFMQKLDTATHRAGYRSAKGLSGPNPAALCGPASSTEGGTVGGSADCRVLLLSALACGAERGHGGLVAYCGTDRRHSCWWWSSRFSP